MQQIDTLILEEWKGGAKTFRTLLAKLPGIYPAEVLCSLRRLRKVCKISEVEVLAIELEVASKPTCHERLVDHGHRHIEHPLDFEWRFTKQSVARICSEINRLALPKRAEILCLGCPSLYLLGKHCLQDFKFHLWDKNTVHLGQIDEANEVSCFDVEQEVPLERIADVAVIDPPWYNDYYFLFLWAAFNCLPRNGKVLLSYPPQGTRPSVSEELQQLKKWCASHGFKFEKCEPGCLPYRAPLFEVNALRAQGVANFPIDWRRGDLLVFSKESEEPFSKPQLSLTKRTWEEVRVHNCRIKVCKFQRASDPILASVGQTEILPSVSSRHKLRKAANVVTSGNRFFRTNSPEALLCCLRQIGTSVARNMKDSFIVAKHPLLMRKAKDLVSKENKEALQYFRRINEF